LQRIKAAKRHTSHQKKFGSFGLAYLSAEKVEVGPGTAPTEDARTQLGGEGVGEGEATKIAMHQSSQAPSQPPEKVRQL
jgi:hypothetical protein